MPKYHGLSREEERKTVTKEKKRKRRNRGNSYRGEATTGTFTFPSVVPFFSFFFFFFFPSPSMFMPISTEAREWPAMAQDTPRLLDPAVVVPLWRSTKVECAIIDRYDDKCQSQNDCRSF